MLRVRAAQTFSFITLVCAVIVSAWLPAQAGAAQATLRWDYAASGAAGFALYCGTASRSYPTRIDVGNTTTYTITTLVAGTTYYCATTAYDAAKKESGYSAEVSFSTPPASSNTPPQIVSRTPLPFATGVRSGASVTATFNEAVQQSTIAFTLRGPSNTVIPATVTYDGLSLTAELHPLAALAANTTYTATLMSAKDLAGTAMSAAVSWTFTTASSQLTCSPCTIWPASAVPAVTTAADTASVELGVKFRADVNGWITGIRFYKSNLNTGTHIGSLWTAGGTHLASATFGNETASGWQQVSFSTPVAVTAGTTYVASYHTNGGHYSASTSYFTSGSSDSGVLHALKDGIDGGNGVYAYSTGATFPTKSYQSTNYWVDAVFTTGQISCPCTLWPPSAVPAIASYPDGRPIEVGVRFRSDRAGQITGIRFYKAPANTGAHVASLWTASGTLLFRATFGTETASGWQQVNFSTPIAISAGSVYVASYHSDSGHYAADHDYFALGGVDNGYLHALKDDVSGANGLYAYSRASTFPARSFGSANYWVDVVFQ